MKRTLSISVIAFGVVGIATALGFPEGAGLFGAILGVGYYLAGEIKE